MPSDPNDRILRELQDCAKRLAGPDPDREGAMRGAEDWLMEQAIIAREAAGGV